MRSEPRQHWLELATMGVIGCFTLIYLYGYSDGTDEGELFAIGWGCVVLSLFGPVAEWGMARRRRQGAVALAMSELTGPMLDEDAEFKCKECQSVLAADVCINVRKVFPSRRHMKTYRWIGQCPHCRAENKMPVVERISKAGAGG